MIYKPYGKTGKQVSALGFGGMRFDTKRSIEENALIVRYANEMGVNYFDTAPFYCNDTSEDIMGEAFKNMPNPFYVSTKSSIGSEKTADEVRGRVEKSLRRLGVEKINFFHMWCIKTLDQYKKIIAPGGPYDGALKLKNEGLVDHIVFSVHAKGSEIRTIIEDGRFEGMTVGYNAINFPFRGEGIEAAEEYNIGVATMNPLGGGIIPQNQDYFSFLKTHENESVIQAALRFNASHKAITTVLAGMSSIEEVKHNLEAFKDIEIYTPEQLKEIKDNLRTDMNSLCTSCQYCMHCPKNINIPRYMESYNMRILKNDAALIDQYKHLLEFGELSLDSPKPSECIRCGKCEQLCTQKLDIINRLEYMASKIEN
ncbi:aldo/keto reductase [Candidatus Epulonipiscium fishelsonii]|uniref:Aldo/keto reductase n=1 Tax=Candidatus Epulonipiscium fishelsonii TaxID=77094 RepID=A0ACC8XA26_9FIRM|nr:aldo/keto reductase [Epulopiscium sp. SCG-B11WGA-EpuloA1]ONI43498.1 aldo/keto reductase [Epulopiscium sp. SCG-B05WGA-EpuloA1]